MSIFDNWDRQTEEAFNDPVTHFGGAKRGKSPHNEKSGNDLADEVERLKKEIKRLKKKLKEK